MPPFNRNRKNLQPQTPFRTILRIFSYMREYEKHLLFIFLLILLSTSAQVTGIFLFKPLVNDHILPYIGHSHPDLSGFRRLLGLMSGIYLVGTLSTFAYSRLMLLVAGKTLCAIRTELFAHMQALPIRYFDTHSHGELMSHFTNDTDTLRDMLNQSLVQLIASCITVTGVFCAMLLLSPQLTLIVLFMLGIMLVSVRLLTRKSSVFFAEQQKALGKLNGYIEEIIEGEKEVRIFSHERQSRQDFEQYNETMFATSKSANTYANLLMPLMGCLSYIHYALTAVIGAGLSITGHADLGTLASFLQYTRSFSQPITQISQQFNSILLGLAGAELIFGVLDSEEESDNGDVTRIHTENDPNGQTEESIKKQSWTWRIPNPGGRTRCVPLQGDIRFDDVYFGYSPDLPILQGITLHAEPGQKIAFVGSTGAGKTTLVNLINRFYDVPDGKILFDRIDINRICKADLRRSIALVLQDTYLFTGSIMENIRYGYPGAGDKTVIHAAKLANADYYIRKLPQGYDTVITADGARLSQGERQLLAIARAAVANPPVLIMDEATSSIDTRTEALISEGMDRLMQGKTVFLIAHRLSTVRNADAIMVMENGHIIERGTHGELMRQKGKYYRLCTGMLELS